MRTTIEIRPEHHAKLVELAASRAEKGFSPVIAEALELYLTSIEGRQLTIERALKLEGSITTPDADRLRTATTRIRELWR